MPEMRLRIVTTLILTSLTLGIMGASSGEKVPVSSILQDLPLFREKAMDSGALEAAAFQALGIPRRWSARRLLAQIEVWRTQQNLAPCGHPEAHELVATSCSLAPGSSLDALLVRVLNAWYQGRLLTAGEVTLLYGAPPRFLDGRYTLEGSLLRRREITMTAQDLFQERIYLAGRGVSGVDHWSNVDVARSLRRRWSQSENLTELSRSLNPRSANLRRELMEGLIRPLALYLGEAAGGGEALRRFLDQEGKKPQKLGPLRAPDYQITRSPTLPKGAEKRTPVLRVQERIQKAPRISAVPVKVETTGFAVAYGGTRFAGMD
jgi:hypothetical protein